MSTGLERHVSAARRHPLALAFAWALLVTGCANDWRAMAGSNAKREALQGFLQAGDGNAAAAHLFDRVDLVLEQSSSGLSLDREGLMEEVAPRLIALDGLNTSTTGWAYDFSVSWIPVDDLPTHGYDDVACDSWLNLDPDPDRSHAAGSARTGRELICGRGGAVGDRAVSEAIALHAVEEGVIALRYELWARGVDPLTLPDGAYAVLERISHAIGNGSLLYTRPHWMTPTENYP